MIRGHRQHLNLAIAAMLLAAPLAWGAGIWDGGGDGTSWGDANNWDNNVVPTGGAVTINGAGFGATIGSPLIIDLGVGAVRAVSDATNISNHVKFINGDFDMASTGTFTASDTTFDTGVSIAAAIGNLNFTRVSYNVPIPQTPRGFNFEGKSATFTDTSLSSQGNWNIRGRFGGSPLIAIDNSATVGGVLNLNSDVGTLPAELRIVNNAVARFETSGAASIGNATGLEGGGATLGTATLRIEGARLNAYTSQLVFGKNASVITSNAIIDARGHIRNYMTSPASFDGEGLTMILAPLDLPSRRGEFEVGGTDLGGNDAGLLNNFSLDKLVLGTFSASTMVLTDTRDNDNNDGDFNTLTITGKSEALYVGIVELLGDTSIELNGLKLYYDQLVLNNHQLTIYETTTSGASSVLTSEPLPAVSVLGFHHIPEPSAVALAAGLGLLSLRRRRGM